MCGIAGFYCWGTERPSVSVIKNLLLGQEYRGKDAAGVAFVNNNKVYVLKSRGTPTHFVNRVVPDDTWKHIQASPLALMHARAATQGDQRFDRNNHPVVSAGWAVTHNGQVRNDDDLFEHYDVERAAEVDTIALNVALGHGENLQDSLAQVSTVAGTATFAAVQLGRPKEVVLARINGNPLYINWDKEAKIMYWSSDHGATLYSSRRDLLGMLFTNISCLLPETAMVLSPWGMRLHKLFNKPFFSLHEYTAPKGVGGYSQNQHPVSGAPYNSHLPAHYLPRTDPPSGTHGVTPGTSTPPEAISGNGGTPRPLALPPSSAGGVTKTTQTQPSASSNGLDSAVQLILNKWMEHNDDPYGFTDLQGAFFQSRENYFTLDKPEPRFTIASSFLVGLPPKGVRKSYVTPYGTWHLNDTDRLFKPSRRVRKHFASKLHDTYGAITLPLATGDQQKVLSGIYKLEEIQVRHPEGVVKHVLMCPFCGIMSHGRAWAEWNTTCPWCLVPSYRGETRRTP